MLNSLLRKPTATLLLAATLGIASLPAQAVVITLTGNDNGADVSATYALSFSAIGSSGVCVGCDEDDWEHPKGSSDDLEDYEILMTVVLTNSTVAPNTARISGFGFDFPTGLQSGTPATITGWGYNAANSPFTNVVKIGTDNVTYSAGADGSSLDTCVISGSGKSCTGGGGGGLTRGASTTFYFIFDTTLTAAALEQLLVANYVSDDPATSVIERGTFQICTRWQSVGVGTNTGGSESVCNTPQSTTQVPEPATLGLLGLGLAGLGLRFRRRRS